MEIKINKEKIDFQLEDEKTLGDIINVIQNWIHSSGFVMISLTLDDKEIKIAEQTDWQKTPLKGINCIDIKVNHVSELRISNLETVIRYLGMFSGSILSGDKKMFKELLTGFPFMLESLSGNYIIDNDTSSFSEIIRKLSADELKNLTEEKKEEITKLTDNIKIKVTDALREIQYPEDAIHEITGKLHASASEISEVSVLLQSGKDRQAMEYVVRFSDLTQRFFRILTALGDYGKLEFSNLMIEGKKSMDFYHELRDILSQLLDAFNARDSVLIGDLLEYEIAPRIEILTRLSGKFH
ncbi:MAG: hypothetical protein GXP33_15110 [Spirochaetes bacterium]|nr:hypothetical protein [Spirochaetota bacterium]